MICLGTVKKYCEDYTKIENYEKAVNDQNEMWDCHHIMEEVFTKKELIRAGWYYNRQPYELIFIRSDGHHCNPKLHIGVRRQRGKTLSEEHKRKISEARKGKHKGQHWKLVDGK